MFRKNPVPKSAPHGARGHRAYVIGDVHGRLDLLERLLDEIHRDHDASGGKPAVLVYVGDLIDRGPDSAGVIERLRTYNRPNLRQIVLLGNHEEVLLRILAGDASLIEDWLSFGGAQCLLSYGLDPAPLMEMDSAKAQRKIAKAIPESHSAFLSDCADTFRFGDYLIVHAGIRPGVAVDQQVQSDLRWIREPFLQHDGDHGVVVVHGHTITEQAEIRDNRIGIDTGAYRSGRLTALVVDGTERWLIDTAIPEGSSFSRHNA